MGTRKFILLPIIRVGLDMRREDDFGRIVQIRPLVDEVDRLAVTVQPFQCGLSVRIAGSISPNQENRVW